MIIVLGSIGLDTTSTPNKMVRDVLGGSATYFSLASSFFHPTGVVGVIGTDFPNNYMKILEAKVDLRGVQVKKGRTFRYISKFGYDLNERTTIKTELNVLKHFEPTLIGEYMNAEYVYLGNIDPEQQLKFVDQVSNPKLVISDTINLWIDLKRDVFREVISKTHGLIINNEELQLLCGVFNLVKCSQMALDWGINFIVVKKGEHGAILSTKEKIFTSPAFPVTEVVDPTGAGDAFAGGFLGHIARKGEIDDKTLKEATVYGHVMGSFVVEDFSVNRLLKLTNEEIEKRFHEYIKITAL